MTVASGPILFNNSTGSDTTASGLGLTNVYGTGASTTGASAVVTGISTTGIRAGDLLWVQSSSGRQFSIIATVDSSTQVTCDNNFDNTESGRTWAIGGKRATFDNADSRKIFADIGIYNAAKIQTETDQTLTSAIAATSQNVGVSGYIESADSTIKTITQTANAYHFAGGGGPLFLKKLKLDNSSSSKPASVFRWDNGVGRLNVHLEQCTIGDPTNTCVTVISGGGSFGSKVSMNNCVIQNMTSTYAFSGAASYEQLLTNNLFINNNVCIGFGGSGGGVNGAVVGNIFANSTAGVSQARIRSVLMRNNIFYNCTSGVYWFVEGPVVLDNNLFVDCTTAINNSHNYGGYEATYLSVYSNFFYNNATKYANNTEQSPGRFGDVDLTADPFVSAANGNFNLNDFPGGGNLLRAKYYELGGN
jgi:hypothetical protein